MLYYTCLPLVSIVSSTVLARATTTLASFFFFLVCVFGRSRRTEPSQCKKKKKSRFILIIHLALEYIHAIFIKRKLANQPEEEEEGRRL